MTDREIFIESLDNSIDIPAKEKMAEYFDALVHINQQINLTAITRPDDSARKHFNDSITSLPYIPNGAKVLDVGTGGGFPGVPIKITRNDIDMYLLDSVNKKTDAVKSMCESASIDVTVLCARAEELKEYRNSFDVVLSRAVASLPVLLEICIPLVKTNGVFIAYKQSDAEDIRNTGMCRKLGAGLEKRIDDNNRSLLIFRKTKTTPDIYPRRYAQIKKSPLD